MFFKNKIYWEKKGLIIKPRRTIYFERSHAMVPTPLKINDDILNSVLDTFFDCLFSFLQIV